MQFDHVEDLLEFGEVNTICMKEKVSDGMEPEYMMRVYICRQDLIQMIQTHSQVIGIQMMRSIKIS